jgi:hypothetical protein
VTVDVHEALYTTRMMRRMRPDPVPVEVQGRILDAAIRAPNGGNAQRWHFLTVDDPALKAELATLYRAARELEYAEFAAGTLAHTAHDPVAHAETMGRIKKSGDYFTDHFEQIPLLLFVFAIDDHGGARVVLSISSRIRLWLSMLHTGSPTSSAVSPATPFADSRHRTSATRFATRRSPQPAAGCSSASCAAIRVYGCGCGYMSCKRYR